MAKATTIRDALKQFEEKTGLKASEAEEVKLYGMLPPIEKMDASLSQLKNCKTLSLSTNSIDKIAQLNGLEKLEVLSLGRNNLKTIVGLDPVSDTLTQLWISYNNIEKLNGIEKLKKLKVLYMSNNRIDKWSEFERLQSLPELEDLLFTGNPLERRYSEDSKVWRIEVLKRLPGLKKIDGAFVEAEDRQAAEDAKKAEG